MYHHRGAPGADVTPRSKPFHYTSPSSAQSLIRIRHLKDLQGTEMVFQLTWQLCRDLETDSPLVFSSVNPGKFHLFSEECNWTHSSIVRSRIWPSTCFWVFFNTMGRAPCVFNKKVYVKLSDSLGAMEGRSTRTKRTDVFFESVDIKKPLITIHCWVVTYISNLAPEIS